MACLREAHHNLCSYIPSYAESAYERHNSILWLLGAWVRFATRNNAECDPREPQHTQHRRIRIGRLRDFAGNKLHGRCPGKLLIARKAAHASKDAERRNALSAKRLSFLIDAVQ